MKKYKKKPVIVEAIKYSSDIWNEEIAANSKSDTYPMVKLDIVPRFDPSTHGPTMDFNQVIETELGSLDIKDGDFIIKDPNGGYYPCSPDRFFNRYDEVTE